MKNFSLTLIAFALACVQGCGGSGGSSSDSGGSSSSSSVGSSSSSAGISENWELVWEDEFDGESIDSQKWGFEVNCVGGGNNELQCYTDREENAYVEDGRLHIVARQESFAGPGKWDDDPSYDPADTSEQRDYTSARLRSKNKGDFTYGRMEIRAKLPQGQGIWPAFWMLPTESVYGGWPLSGEIDVLEAVNTNASGGNEVHGTLHYGRAFPANEFSGTSYVPTANVWENFHTYAVEWSEGAIHWFVDDAHYATQTSDGWYTYYPGDNGEGYQLGEGAAPFDRAFHMIMNLAVGGNWPGAPDGGTEFPQTLEVEHVRVYQCSLNPQTGKGCSDRLNPDVQPLEGVPAPEIHQYSLYDDGAVPLTLDSPAGEVVSEMTPGQFAQTPGNLVVDPSESVEGDTVWSAEFFGLANIFLGTDDHSDSSTLAAGVNLASMVSTGQLAFDILVEEVSEQASITIKMDSGWPNVSVASIDPPTGEWTRYALRLSEFSPNPVEPGQVNFAEVINPFVLEVSGANATIKLRDIALECAGDCAPEAVLAGQSATIESPHTVFDDSVDVNWDFGFGLYDNNTGHVTVDIVDEGGERGPVLDAQFSDSENNGLAFVQSTTTRDMSAFAGGTLSFDVRVPDYGTASGLVIRADCLYPCSSGDIALGMVGAAGWETVEVPVDDLVAGGLDLSRVNTPLAFMPTWNAQAGVHIQVDNIRYTD